MGKILTIAWKELYVTFRDRNLILIMFLTPILLSTIMGLAFGGLGGDDSIGTFSDIPIAVVNLDDGFNLAEQIGTSGTDPLSGTMPSLNDVEFEVGGQTINLGEQFQINANLNITDTDLDADNASFVFGDILADILLSEPITATSATTDTTATVTETNGFTFEDIECPLTEADGQGENDVQGGFSSSLADLFAAVAVGDAESARAGVDRGDYVAAVIIPASFSNSLLPTFDYFETETAAATTNTDPGISEGAVEVYANAGQSISASIVRAVVEGIVNQLVRVSVALDSVLGATVDSLLNALNLNTLDNLNLSAVDPTLVTQAIQSLDASLLDPLACLLVPGAGNVQLQQQPLDELQTRSSFAFIMIILGSAQAIFFAMFTGIFGVNSIYEEQDNWTLQRMVASPTPRSYILIGKLLGNVVVVTVQLLILFTSFTVITSLVEGAPNFIWGTNIPALATVVLAIALFVSGLGVLVVGLAKNAEQVRFIGPMVASSLAALGGSFGFRLPATIAGISPIWWGSEALIRVSNGETDTLQTPLLVLFGTGIITFTIGTFFFKRRLDL